MPNGQKKTVIIVLSKDILRTQKFYKYFIDQNELSTKSILLSRQIIRKRI